MRESGNVSVGTQLARILRDRIARRRYSLKVPTEGELMEEFGMSRYGFQVEHDVVGHASLLQVGRVFIASCLRDGVSTVDRSVAT